MRTPSTQTTRFPQIISCSQPQIKPNRKAATMSKTYRPQIKDTYELEAKTVRDYNKRNKKHNQFYIELDNVEEKNIYEEKSEENIQNAT